MFLKINKEGVLSYEEYVFGKYSGWEGPSPCKWHLTDKSYRCGTSGGFMSLNWINVEEYSFNSFLLMERFQLRLLLKTAEQHEQLAQQLGIALWANPAVRWYFLHKCPECGTFVESLGTKSKKTADTQEIRAAELYVLSFVEDFVTYTTPEVMDEKCDFIYAWNKERLFELTDFQGKTVLDVGSGSGRLAFAAAEKARGVYACEPVDCLREYLRDKIRRENIKNIRVVDGMADNLAYPDNTFDIVMSGHVVGDDYEAELSEIFRVVKSGGWVLDCPGEQTRKSEPDKELLRRGFEGFHYTSSLGGDVYRYRKQIIKNS